MLNANPTKKAVHEWTNAYGDWLTAGSDVWRLANARIDRETPASEEIYSACRKLDAAHERLKRALDQL